jgi:hypothetical protein
MPDDDEIVVELRCPRCRAVLQRTLQYLRAHRVLWCENCGRAIRYGDEAVQQAEELLRRSLH